MFSSPFGNVEPPDCKAPPKPVLSVNDAFQLLKWLRERRPTAYMAAYLAIYTGMRMGEPAGLQWRDIDLKAGLIHLEGTRFRPQFAFRTLRRHLLCPSITQFRLQERNLDCHRFRFMVFDIHTRRGYSKAESI